MAGEALADPLRAFAAAADDTITAATASAAEASSLPAAHGQEADADAGEGLAVVKRIDFSSICSQVESDAVDGDGGGGVDREMLFYDTDLKVDVAANMHVVVGFRTALFTTRDAEDEDDGDATGRALLASRLATSVKQRGSDAQSASVRFELQSLQLLSDGSEFQLEDEERITDVKWIGDEHFCASYTSGIIRIFTHTGTLVLEQVCASVEEIAGCNAGYHANPQLCLVL